MSQDRSRPQSIADLDDSRFNLNFSGRGTSALELEAALEGFN